MCTHTRARTHARMRVQVQTTPSIDVSTPLAPPPQHASETTPPPTGEAVLPAADAVSAERRAPSLAHEPRTNKTLMHFKEDVGERGSADGSRSAHPAAQLLEVTPAEVQMVDVVLGEPAKEVLSLYNGDSVPVRFVLIVPKGLRSGNATAHITPPTKPLST